MLRQACFAVQERITVGHVGAATVPAWLHRVRRAGRAHLRPATSAVLEREGIAVDPAKIDMPPGEAGSARAKVINTPSTFSVSCVNSIGAVFLWCTMSDLAN